MNEQSIQMVGYSSLQVHSAFSLPAAAKNENTDRIENGSLRVQQSAYFDFRMMIQYRSEKHIDQQAAQFDFLKPKEATFPISDIKGTAISHAQELVSANGYFGIKQTSGRIAEFVLNGAGDDIEKLKAGREGVLRGFKEAEKIWGGRLPEISYETIDQALQQIDEKIYSREGSIIDTTA